MSACEPNFPIPRDPAIYLTQHGLTVSLDVLNVYARFADLGGSSVWDVVRALVDATELSFDSIRALGVDVSSDIRKRRVTFRFGAVEPVVANSKDPDSIADALLLLMREAAQQ